MVNVTARAQQLAAEVVITDNTAAGAQSIEGNIERIGDAFEKTDASVKRTAGGVDAAEAAYQKLVRKIEPLANIVEKYETGLIAIEKTERLSIETTNAHASAREDYASALEETIAANDNAAAALERQQSAAQNAAAAGEEMNAVIQRQEASLSSLANSTIETTGKFAGLAAGVVALKVAQLEAIDNSTKLSVALGLLGRVLPIAAVAALGLAFIKMGVAAVRAVRSVISESIELGKTQREAELQVVSAIQSTGAAANRSLKDIKALASELQNLTNFGDEKIIRGGAQLLTFTNISDENFDRTLRSSVDVAARLGRDVEQVALQLGKALNDPIRNLGALTESGIQFTDGQRNLIRSLTEVGEVAAAQAIILAELENQFAGAAAAQREAEGGAAALANAWGDVKEALGDEVVARTAASTSRLARAVADPVWAGFARTIGAIVGGFKNLGIAIRASLIQGAADFFRGLGIIWSDASRGVSNLAKEIVAFDSKAAAVNGLTSFVDGVKQLISIDVTPFFDALGKGFRAFGGVLDAVEKRLGSVLSKVREGIKTATGGRLSDGPLRDAVRGAVVAAPITVPTGVGRRAREGGVHASSTSELNASFTRIPANDNTLSPIAAALPTIVKHYEALHAAQQKYHKILREGGPQALAHFKEQQELLKRIADETDGLPDAEAERVKQAILGIAAEERRMALYEQQSAFLNRQAELIAQLQQKKTDLTGGVEGPSLSDEDLVRAERVRDIEAQILDLRREAEKVGAGEQFQEKRIRSLIKENDLLQAQVDFKRTLSDLDTDNDRLRQLVDAASQGSEELEIARQRFEIEDRIAAVKLEAARLGRDLSDEELQNLRDRLEENQKLRNQLKVKSSSVNEDIDFGTGELEFHLEGAVNSFFDRFARNGKIGARQFARDLKNALLRGALNPFSEKLSRTISGLLSGKRLGGGIFSPSAIGDRGAQFFEGVDQFFRRQGINVRGLGQAAGAAFGGFSLGQGVSDLLGLKRGGPGRRALTGAATGFTVAGPVGGIAGAAIGALSGLFGNKPSDNTAGAQLDLNNFSLSNEFSKNNNAENIALRDELFRATTDLAKTFKDLTGADFAGSLAINVGNRDGVRISSSVGGQATTPVGDAQAALDEIVFHLTRSLSGGNEEILSFVQAMAAAKEPLENIVDQAGRLKEALSFNDEPISALQERIQAIDETIGDLIEKQKALGLNTDKLSKTYETAIARIGEDINEQNRDGVTGLDNPRLARINALLEAQEGARKDADFAANKGAEVDRSLQNDFQRKQLLSEFNIDGRLAQGVDPVAASVGALRRDQANERAALRAAIDGVRIFESDLAALIRAQEFERIDYFKNLPQEDRLRLSGQVDDFESVEARYGLTVFSIIRAWRKTG